MDPVGILIIIVVVAVVLWATQALLSAFRVPAPVNTIIFVVVVIVVLLWIIRRAGISI